MSRHRTNSTISRGVDYVIILSRALALRRLASIVYDKSRRVALARSQSLSFRISRYGVIPIGVRSVEFGVFTPHSEFRIPHFGRLPTALPCSNRA